LTYQFTSPLRREFWSRALVDLGLVLGISVVVSLGVLRLLRPARRIFQDYHPPTPLHLIVGTALHVGLRLVPVAVFAATAIAVGVILDLGVFTREVAAALVTGLAFVTAFTASIRAILNYRNPHMRLLPLDAETGAAVQAGLIRVAAVGGYGYFGLEAARALGLPWTLHGFLQHVLFLVTFLLYVRLVLRFRREGAQGFEVLGESGTAGLLGRFLPWEKVARVWHWGAILFGLAIYGAWALQVPGGPVFLLRAMLLTIFILVLSRLFHVWLGQRATAQPSGRADDGEDADLSEALASAAQSPLNFVWRGLTTVITLALILQVWGVDILGLLASETGRQLRNAAATSGLTILLAYVIWKIVSMAIRGAVDEKDALGRPARSNRSRTLLTIGRNLLFVLIWVTAGLTVLSELGVNLAPLLAGAGVIGLAIGFGSQQLVRDIITGFFILIEDTVSVGDVAELGGKSGVVEAVTLRTVRLRSYDGQVHTVPFSSIDTISNFTKDFSYYVFDVGVAYKESTDRVIEVMREIGAEMQRERAYRRLILDPLDVAGVDRFEDSAVVIRARIKTRPLQQWTVGREFNRRLKQRFDALGIEIPFPQRTLHMIPQPGAQQVPAAPPPGMAAS
jgi:small-conductance mechanosensitive channel